MSSDTSPEFSPHRELILEVAREMRLLSSFVALFSHAVGEQVGMHSTDIETVDFLNVMGPMTAGQLGELLSLSSGATTRLIDRLQHAGLVRRVADPADRRRVIIQPVYENLAELGACFQPMKEALGELWDQFSDEELATVVRFVRETNEVIAAQNARLRNAGE